MHMFKVPNFFAPRTLYTKYIEPGSNFLGFFLGYVMAAPLINIGCRTLATTYVVAAGGDKLRPLMKQLFVPART